MGFPLAVPPRVLVTPTCPVCGDHLELASAVACRRCDTPHHLECWSYAKGCGTMACGGRTRVRALRRFPELVAPDRELSRLCFGDTGTTVLVVSTLFLLVFAPLFLGLHPSPRGTMSLLQSLSGLLCLWPLAFQESFHLDASSRVLRSQVKALGLPLTGSTVVGDFSCFREVRLESHQAKGGPLWRILLARTHQEPLQVGTEGRSPAMAVERAEALARAMDLTVALPPELELDATA